MNTRYRFPIIALIFFGLSVATATDAYAQQYRTRNTPKYRFYRKQATPLGPKYVSRSNVVTSAAISANVLNRRDSRKGPSLIDRKTARVGPKVSLHPQQGRTPNVEGKSDGRIGPDFFRTAHAKSPSIIGRRDARVGPMVHTRSTYRIGVNVVNRRGARVGPTLYKRYKSGISPSYGR